MGASVWPRWPDLDRSAFQQSYLEFREYLTGVLDVPAEHLLDLFGNDRAPNELVSNIKTFVGGDTIADAPYLIVYYVGHGDRVADDDSYSLFTACADSNNKVSSSFPIRFFVEALQEATKRRPVILVLDACFAAAAAQTFLRPFPANGVTILASAGTGDVSRTPEDASVTVFTDTLLTVLKRGDPYRKKNLSLRDVKSLMEDELDLRPADDRPHFELHSPNQDSGDLADEQVLPNLAHPTTDGDRTGATETRMWCGVVSEADGRGDRQIFADLLIRFGDLYRGSIKKQTGWSLSETPMIVQAADVFSSPRAFRQAVQAVCLADLVFFDLTEMEPAAMVLLGIRAIIRRGVSICSTADDPDRKTSAPPFLLRDINVMRHGPPVKRPENILGVRAVAGIRELTRAPYRYSDLPGFDVVRQLSPIHTEQPVIPYYDRVLFLCPFNPVYNKITFPNVIRNLEGAIGRARTNQLATHAATEPPGETTERTVQIERTLDMGSPRTVSVNLLEAIRMTDLCICDVTDWKPNVLFELGLRLAAHPMDPVCILATDSVMPDGAAEEVETHYQQSQREGLRRVLDVIDFDPGTYEDYHRIISRHLQIRSESQRSRLRGEDENHISPGSIYELAWRFADSRHEPSAAGVVDLLRLSAGELAPDRSLGSTPVIFPQNHRLTTLAWENAAQRLMAAWLYLDHRYTTGRERTTRAVEDLIQIGTDLSNLLADSSDERDRNFREQIDTRCDGLRADRMEGSPDEP